MRRFFYSIAQAIHHWTALKIYMNFENPWRVSAITQLSPEWLTVQGIKHLALDFDGVLSPHGDAEPLPEVVAWLKKFASNFSGKIYILSNKPLSIRQAYFKEHFPEIVFIIAQRKKPYPDGLLEIQKISGAKPNEIALVDDRLLTGILATQIAGAHAVYITQPYSNRSNRFVQECFFSMLRVLERFWLA